MKQSEIWLINLDPTIGAEIKKIRPALIVNDDSIGRLPLKIIVPFTDRKDHYQTAPWMVKVIPDKKNCLSKMLAADCFQVRSISDQRFVKKMGHIDEIALDIVKVALAKVLSLAY